MKVLKKFTAVVMVVLLSASIVGCSGSGSKVSAEEVIAAASEKLVDVKSMESRMNMDITLSAEDESFSMVTTADIVGFNEPAKFKIDMNLDMGELGSQSMLMYVEEVDGTYTMYMSDGTQWYSEPLGSDFLDQYDTKDNMALYLENISNFSITDEEEVNGSAAYKIEGIISGEGLEETIASSGALDSLNSLGLSPDMVADIYADLGDLPISIWFDKETSYPVKYDMNMKDMMQKIYDKLFTSMEAVDFTITVDSMSIIVESFNYNSAEDFTIPEEAKS